MTAIEPVDFPQILAVPALAQVIPITMKLGLGPMQSGISEDSETGAYTSEFTCAGHTGMEAEDRRNQAGTHREKSQQLSGTARTRLA